MFSIKEQKGIFVLIFLITIVLLSKYIKEHKSQKTIENRIEDNKINIVSVKPYLMPINRDTSFKSKRKIQNPCNNPISKKTKYHKKLIITDFDPNAVSYSSLLNMGLSKKAARNWVKYIKKGGKFKVKTDIKKIYGLKETSFERFKAHIMLPDTINFRKTTKQLSETYTASKNHFINKNILIELNSCTADELKKLNGIGEKLSARIIKFRNKLGGFYSVNQLKEVYGLPNETFEKIKENLTVDKNKIRKLKINLASKSSLQGFPYFNYRLAFQLVNYRKQHGYFKGIDDVKRLKTIDSTKINKIEPYLDFALN